jgi:predicted amidohydrolase
MIDNETLTVLSDDPADVFSQLWDVLPEDQFVGFDVWEWLTDEGIQDLAGYVEESLLNDGRFVPGRVAELIESADEVEERVFAIMLGVDRALLHVNPFVASYDQGELAYLARRYASTGRLSTAAIEGALLPRCAFPGRPRAAPNTIADAFVGVVRVSSDIWNATAHSQIPARNDFSRVARDRGVRVACVAMLESVKDVRITANSRSSRRVFRIEPSDEDFLLERIETVLEALDQSGTQLAVLPELALSERLLNHWVEVLQANKPPPISDLRWIFLGTGNVTSASPPVNRGVLMDRRSAEILLTQDKLFPFTLSTQQLYDWGLRELLGEEDIDEDLMPGERITVTESRLGRLTILVCEDLGRIFDLGPALREHGISLSLAPIFSKPVLRHHWEHTRAKDYATEVGVATVVSNSIVIGRLTGERGAIGSCLVHSPDQTELGSVEASTDVVQMTVEQRFYRDDLDAM